MRTRPSSRRIALRELRREAAAHQVEPGDAQLLAEHAANRPVTRADCEAVERPCPYLSCRYHLFLDVTEHGSIRLNFPGAELHELPDTCALDVADRHGVILEEVGSLLNLTRERIRQVEEQALATLRRRVG